MNFFHNCHTIRRALLVVVLATLAAVAYAQDAEDPIEATPFWSEIAPLLSRSGWPRAEIDRLAAEHVDWRAYRARDAQVAALAFRYALETDARIDREGQAQILAQVAELSRRMRSLGYDEAQTTRTAVNGVREAVRTREQGLAPAESGEEFGDLLRTRLRQQLSQTEGEAVATRRRTEAREEARAGIGDPSGNGSGGLNGGAAEGGGSTGGGGGRR